MNAKPNQLQILEKPPRLSIYITESTQISSTEHCNEEAAATIILDNADGIMCDLSFVATSVCMYHHLQQCPSVQIYVGSLLNPYLSSCVQHIQYSRMGIDNCLFLISILCKHRIKVPI